MQRVLLFSASSFPGMPDASEWVVVPERTWDAVLIGLPLDPDAIDAAAAQSPS